MWISSASIGTSHEGRRPRERSHFPYRELRTKCRTDVSGGNQPPNNRIREQDNQKPSASKSKRFVIFVKKQNFGATFRSAKCNLILIWTKRSVFVAFTCSDCPSLKDRPRYDWPKRKNIKFILSFGSFYLYFTIKQNIQFRTNRTMLNKYLTLRNFAIHLCAFCLLRALKDSRQFVLETFFTATWPKLNVIPRAAANSTGQDFHALFTFGRSVTWLAVDRKLINYFSVRSLDGFQQRLKSVKLTRPPRHALPVDENSKVCGRMLQSLFYHEGVQCVLSNLMGIRKKGRPLHYSRSSSSVKIQAGRKGSFLLSLFLFSIKRWLLSFMHTKHYSWAHLVDLNCIIVFECSLFWFRRHILSLPPFLLGTLFCTRYRLCKTNIRACYL